MKKGYLINTHQELISSYYDMVYINAMLGKVIDPRFYKNWGDLSPLKRGLVHQPVLSITNDVNENASAFLGLLNDLSYSGWNNGIPLIIDIWQAPEANRYNLDNIRQHGIYITERYKPALKPLLRVILSVWNKWYAGNPTETMRLFNDYEILLCQPEALKPSKLDGFTIPTWWEYNWGMFVNDPTAVYAGVVTPPEPVEEPEPIEEPPVVIPQPTDPVSISFPKKWKISLLGGLIKGTIEAEE